ncbi:MAG: recombinase family protein, partial [Actinobacteria bacterium]|nr:recombinase family protein [Actinomycetota bacterium]
HKTKQNGPDALSLQIEDLCKTLEDAPFECTEYKDSIVRQMIDTIKVMNADTLRIIFKGGYEVGQPLNMEGI